MDQSIWQFIRRWEDYFKNNCFLLAELRGSINRLVVDAALAVWLKASRQSPPWADSLVRVRMAFWNVSGAPTKQTPEPLKAIAKTWFEKESKLVHSFGSSCCHPGWRLDNDPQMEFRWNLPLVNLTIMTIRTWLCIDSAHVSTNKAPRFASISADVHFSANGFILRIPVRWGCKTNSHNKYA